ncbi:MAG TPA: hypothetical protein PKD56_11900, partial [Chitinophagales bacterium]|nr:hypothetical protein [Chitinophagales bacterium]
THQGGKLEILGIENGTRDLPDNFAHRSILNGSNREAANAQFRSLNPFFDVRQQQILPDLRFNAGLSRLIKMGDKTLFN